MKTFFGNGFGSSFGKIVAMDRFDSGHSLSPIRQAEAYWTALLTGDGVPMRSQIDPRGLENILEYTFVLERIAPGLTRFRLAGRHLNQLAGMEVRGMPLTSFFELGARDQIKTVSEQVFAQPAIANLTLGSSGRLGRVQLQARMLLLPLKSDLGDVSRILGVTVSDGVIGATPRRFTISETNLRPVSDVQVPQQPSETVETGFAEDQQRFDRPGAHLRLVVSRDD
ncbi:PAS domain-containing protein [Ruegeria atlantica]|uniref:PAS domain-containing protein n=1 Tax=Ruegeria atlantica TaxID=81569 RepID=UPI00249440F8|nr:PAS domain-containing protein [Ruegeria atlantica]